MRDRKLFYSIKDINIGGQCVCNGHASSCRHNVASGVSIQLKTLIELRRYLKLAEKSIATGNRKLPRLQSREMDRSVQKFGMCPNCLNDKFAVISRVSK